RYLGTGDIDYLGRFDHQVKLRGFRIELEEIEAVLNGEPGIKETVVLAREDEPGSKQLVAYVVSEPNASFSSHDLRRVLAEKLPDYMVPSVFVFLEKLPLTNNGKIDRRALPKPEPRTDVERQVEPENAVEEILRGIWEQVLGVDEIGVEENFFEL